MTRQTLNDLEYQKFSKGLPVCSTTILPNKTVIDCGTFAALTTGATGAHSLFTVTGIVAVSVFGVCETDLTVGGATTLEVGTASSTAGLLPQITASNWDANEVWEMTDANLNKLVLDSLLLKKIVTESSIILTIGTSTVTGGTAKIYVSWYPISEDGNLTVVSPFA